MVDISPVIVIVIDMIIFVFYIGVQNSIKGQVEEGKTKIVEEPSHMDLMQVMCLYNVLSKKMNKGKTYKQATSFIHMIICICEIYDYVFLKKTSEQKQYLGTHFKLKDGLGLVHNFSFCNTHVSIQLNI